MSYQAQFAGWDALSIEDLLIAYRRAKTDCFFENTFPTAIKFAEYEQDLLTNLQNLLARLKRDAGFESNEDLLGDFRLLPKKLSTEKKADSTENGHVHLDPESAHECAQSMGRAGDAHMGQNRASLGLLVAGWSAV